MLNFTKMQKAFRLLIIVFILSISSSAFAALLVNVPLKNNISDFNTEAYDFIYRLLTKRAVRGIPRGILPLSRGEICAILLELEKREKNSEIKLSRVDKKRFEALKEYFSDELQKLDNNRGNSQKKKHVLELKKDQYHFSLDLSLLSESLTRNGKSFSQNGTQYTTSILPAIYGQVGDDFAFASLMAYRFFVGDFFADTFKDEARQTQLSGKLKNTATIDGYFLFKLPWFSIQLGQDNLRWGPGYNGTLLVSENPPPWDMFKLTAAYKPIKFDAFTAILRSEKQKYLSGHRIEGFLGNRIGIGLSEVIVYGNYFEPSYINPMTIYLISDLRNAPSSGINANVLISGDVRICLDNVELYGELMVDDMNLQGPSVDLRYWDNKFGIMGGIYLTDPLGFPDTDLHLEYAFINQYAYTHEEPINVYKHFNSVIGHHIGSDADDFWVQLKHRFTDKLETTLTYELERHGEGDITKGIPPTKTVSTWTPLSGVTESEHSISVGLSYTHIGRYRLGIEYRNNWLKNLGNQRGKKASGQEITIEGVYRF